MLLQPILKAIPNLFVFCYLLTHIVPVQYKIKGLIVIRLDVFIANKKVSLIIIFLIRICTFISAGNVIARAAINR